jgi:hypothetical protein
MPELSSGQTITFRVISQSLPRASKIFLTSTHSKLGNWQPNVVPGASNLTQAGRAAFRFIKARNWSLKLPAAIGKASF